MKDLFSNQAGAYAASRPAYPEALFDAICSHVQAMDRAWDCGTGSGQAAVMLADRFSEVFATDISREQLHRAVQKPNIHYSVQPAERTGFPDRYFDLALVAQAIHWFDFDRYYAEVRRVVKPGGMVAAIGYGLPRISPAVDILLDHFYTETLAGWWEKERSYLDAHYRTLPFPFKEIAPPALDFDATWTANRFIVFLRSWSAVQACAAKSGVNPVDAVEKEFVKNWPVGRTPNIRFPIFARLGIISW